MPRESSPAFQFYPRDFLCDDKVMAMSTTARGCYIVLLCHCWLTGFVTADQSELRRLSQYDGHDWPRIWGQLKRAFVPKDGALVNPRIERERKKQADYRELKRKAGLESANRRATEGQQAHNRPSTDPPTAVNPPSSSSSSYPDLKDLDNSNVLASTTSENGKKPRSLSQEEQDKAARYAAARAMDRPWQKEKRRGVPRNR